MSTALHAQRILDAWDHFNYTQFEAELDSALRTCKTSGSASELENEERTVLETVVRQFQAFPLDNGRRRLYRLGAGVLLLRHLQTR